MDISLISKLTGLSNEQINKLNDLSEDIIYITDYPDMVYKNLNNKTYLKK